MVGHRRVLLLIAACLTAGGCDRAASAEPTATARLRLGYFPNVTHAQAVLGVAGGDFAAAAGPGVRFSGQPFNAGPSLIWALFAGEIDVGYVGPGPALLGWTRSRGRGIRVISGAAADGVVIVARPGSGIRTMADLRGRKIATPQYGNTQDVAARHYLTAVFGQADTDNVLPIANADQTAALARGAVDAAWVPEPWGAVLERSAGATIIGQEKDLWPGGTFALTVIVTTPEYLTAHGDVIDRLLAVHRQWTDRLAVDPGRYAAPLEAALAKLSGKRLPAGVVAESLGRVRFTTDPMPATFAADARWAAELGFASDVPDLAGMIVEGRAGNGGDPGLRRTSDAGVIGIGGRQP